MIRILTLIICMFAGAVLAVEPDEILDDPVLEARARSISAGLRCLQCRNESIDESNAGIARDLRKLVRARLLAGDSDTEVVDYITARYGEFVLLRPNGGGVNVVLWAAGPVAFIFAMLGVAVFGHRRRSEPQRTTALSDAEKKRLAQLLDN